MIIFDCETTGFSPNNDRMVQLSYLLFDLKSAKKTFKNFYFYQKYVPKEAVNVHRLTPEVLLEKTGGITEEAYFDEICNDFLEDDLLAGHNIEFDKRFILSFFNRYDKNSHIITAVTYCTMRSFIHVCRFTPKLRELIEFLEIAKDINNIACRLNLPVSFHNSIYDVLCVSQILRKGIEKGYIREARLLAYQDMLANLTDNLTFKEEVAKEQPRAKSEVEQPLINNTFSNTLDKAFSERKTVRLKYISNTSGYTERLLDIYGIDLPYFVGFCHLREEGRVFRIDRIEALEITNRRYKFKDWVLEQLEENNFIRIEEESAKKKIKELEEKLKEEQEARRKLEAELEAEKKKFY